MRVIAINKKNSDQYQNYLEQMYQLRAKVFLGRLGWEVAVENGREFDAFDELDPTYIVCVLNDGTVAGCARLLPALGPTMLEVTFPQLIGKGLYHPHKAMVESSRFCVDTTLPVASSRQWANKMTNMMFAGIIEWCMKNSISEIMTVTDLRFERILGISRWPLQRIGEPLEIGVTTAIAGTLPADMESFNKLRPEGYWSDLSVPSKIAA
ncbi:acyl-homoserine-lactone synthase [Microvirga sp. W0021]|uniref:Acyl-homoserine-lactone synthase n=1 Tax=Hohaiivirga grylli TaxID=3133970 RepID=A0ABV0BIR4_9HYPH